MRTSANSSDCRSHQIVEAGQGSPGLAAVQRRRLLVARPSEDQQGAHCQATNHHFGEDPHDRKVHLTPPGRVIIGRLERCASHVQGREA